ncbi:MAG: hypothetical protein HY331_08495 [Chloroflexi bacterium]|nr:hypothetical protein [Chloroflexota bacterium]
MTPGLLVALALALAQQLLLWGFTAEGAAVHLLCARGIRVGEWPPGCPIQPIEGVPGVLWPAMLAVAGTVVEPLAAAKLLGAALTLGSTLLIWRLGRTVSTEGPIWPAPVLAALLPAFVLWGVAGLETPLLVFLLLLGLDLMVKARDRVRQCLAGAVFALATVTSVGAILLVPVLAAYVFLIGGPDGRAWRVAAWLAGYFVLAAPYAVWGSLSNSGLDSLLRATAPQSGAADGSHAARYLYEFLLSFGGFLAVAAVLGVPLRRGMIAWWCLFVALLGVLAGSLFVFGPDRYGPFRSLAPAVPLLAILVQEGLKDVAHLVFDPSEKNVAGRTRLIVAVAVSAILLQLLPQVASYQATEGRFAGYEFEGVVSQ